MEVYFGTNKLKKIFSNEIDLEKIFNIKIIEVVDYHGKK
jgi:hypothetical protein